MLVDLELDPTKANVNKNCLEYDFSNGGLKVLMLSGLEEVKGKPEWHTFIQKIDTGIYDAWSMDNDIKFFSNQKLKERETDFMRAEQHFGKRLEFINNEEKLGFSPNYGVADSLENIKEVKKIFFDTPDRKFILSVSQIRREDQPERDGWRWEKWGPYIGTRKSQADYLYHEPEIESVLIFHFSEVE